MTSVLMLNSTVYRQSTYILDLTSTATSVQGEPRLFAVEPSLENAPRLPLFHVSLGRPLRSRHRTFCASQRINPSWKRVTGPRYAWDWMSGRMDARSQERMWFPPLRPRLFMARGLGYDKMATRRDIDGAGEQWQQPECQEGRPEREEASLSGYQSDR